MGDTVKKATFLRELTGFRGDAGLYEVEPPMVDHQNKRYQYVVASAVYAYSGPETLIFGSDSEGEIVNWGELAGLRGMMNHREAFADAGYEVFISVDPPPVMLDD